MSLRFLCDSIDLKVFVCGFLTAYNTLLKFMSKVRKKDYFFGGGRRGTVD